MSKAGDRMVEFENRAVLGNISIGFVYFSVIESDDISISADVTDNPVESGQDVSDHVEPKPDKISIKGVIVGEDAPRKWTMLKNFNKNGTLLKYINRVIYDNVVIQDFNPVHSGDIRNGYKFSMSLKNVRIATPREVAIMNVPPSAQTKAKGVQNAGKKQPKSR